jgi:hypothetical protein
MDAPPPFEPRKYYTLKEFWTEIRIAQRTGQRERARGNSPITTQLSTRRIGILGADANNYILARRQVPRP